MSHTSEMTINLEATSQSVVDDVQANDTLTPANEQPETLTDEAARHLLSILDSHEVLESKLDGLNAQQGLVQTDHSAQAANLGRRLRVHAALIESAMGAVEELTDSIANAAGIASDRQRLIAEVRGYAAQAAAA